MTYFDAVYLHEIALLSIVFSLIGNVVHQNLLTSGISIFEGTYHIIIYKTIYLNKYIYIHI